MVAHYRCSAALCAVLVLPAFLAAQDMVGVDWTGGIHAVDSYTGSTTQIGVGTFGQNCLCRDAGGYLWSCAWSTTTSGYWLTRIDPATLTAAPMFPTGDVRALATGSGGQLYAVTYNGSSNQLFRIETATGAHTLIGPTGTALLQGMTLHNGTLYGWDLGRGLGSIDPATGAFTDIGFAPGGNLQWLAVRHDGQLMGGADALYTIDIVTGLATQVASGMPYLRGAETAAFAAAFGTGCAGGTGQVTLTVAGSLRPGGLLISTSTGHTDFGAVFGGIGLVVIGTSRTSHQGVPLPLLLDPLFGTQGCSLYTSPDFVGVLTTIASSQVMLQFVFSVPSSLHDATFHVQHLGLDAVPGGLSASNGVQVRIAN